MVATYTGTGRRGLAKLTPRLYITDKLNNIREDISRQMLSGSVEMRTDRRIKMRFTGRLRNPSVIRPFSDYLAPWLKIEYTDGSVIDEQLGLYSLPPFSSDSTYLNTIGDFEALDLGWNLSENTFGNYYTVQAGANVVSTVISILAAEGFTRYSIPASSKTFPKTRTYHITRDKWNICNAMLRSIAYYHMWVDRHGIITSMPYIDYDKAEPAKVLFSGKGSDLVGSIRKEPLEDSIYNKVRVIGERPKTNTPIIQTLINSNPNSPTSTVSLGRTRQMPTIEDSDISDSATATEVARAALQRSSSLYNRYELYTLPDPGRGFFEVYDATVNRLDGIAVMEGRYRVSGWDISLDSRTPMRHYMNRNELYQ